MSCANTVIPRLIVSELLHSCILDLSRWILNVSVIAATGTDDQVGFLVDVGVVRVEVLSVVVVKDSWLSIVLHHDLAEGAHILA